MPIDLKYGRVRVEHGSIPDDEPCVLFRAQDKHLSVVLHTYLLLCENGGSPIGHLRRIRETISGIEAWQASHPTKVPD